MPAAIWVDADSIPVEARRMIIRFALKRNIPARFVANRVIPLETKHELISMTVTAQEEGASDNYITAHADFYDIAVTRDIPLASRLVEKNLIVVSDRGRTFTKENIGEYLSLRDFTKDIARMGLYPPRTRAYGAKELGLFANCLDRAITQFEKQREQVLARR
jgi:uncharacterized protein YaiI (UPF0178 family)